MRRQRTEVVVELRKVKTCVEMHSANNTKYNLFMHYLFENVSIETAC